MTGGSIGLRVLASPTTTLTGLGNPPGLLLNSTNPIRFAIIPLGRPSAIGFTLEHPTYGFRVEISPAVQVRVGVDLGIYDYTFGPWAIDSLSVSQSFRMPRHAGTVSSRRYALQTRIPAPLLLSKMP